MFKRYLLYFTVIMIYVFSFKTLSIRVDDLFSDTSNILSLVSDLFNPHFFLFLNTFPFINLTPTFSLVLEKLWESFAIGLLATTLGTLLAIPLSIFSAQNIVFNSRVEKLFYIIIRLFMSILRSIEPLVVAVIFSVWVGIGPLAGFLALTLHTVASLVKLFSEQVENIDMRPINSILQTGIPKIFAVIYGVLPQIFAPFIAHSIYRLDTNVRLSTVLGFVGGGGIGFLLIQWLNLLQFGKVATAIWAIAISIIILDFLSGKIRSKLIKNKVF